MAVDALALLTLFLANSFLYFFLFIAFYNSFIPFTAFILSMLGFMLACNGFCAGIFFCLFIISALVLSLFLNKGEPQKMRDSAEEKAWLSRNSVRRMIIVGPLLGLSALFGFLFQNQFSEKIGSDLPEIFAFAKTIHIENPFLVFILCLFIFLLCLGCIHILQNPQTGKQRSPKK
jgi:hypothetical protein